MSLLDDANEPSSQAPPKCDHCGYILQVEERLFHRCEDDVSSVKCLKCILKDMKLDDGNRWRPCFVDLRDSRLTYLDKPDAFEFQQLITQARKDESFKFPSVCEKFLSGCGDVEGIEQPRFRNSDSYHKEAEDAQDSAISRKIENDYTQYTPLERGRKQIRLVRLLRASWDDPIAVRLTVLEHPWSETEWRALSYSWGPLDETRIIRVNHDYKIATQEDKASLENDAFLFRCTVNLEMALRTLRREDKDVMLWIDAICINQGDLDERADQVAMMSEMYASASGVVAWINLSPWERPVMPIIHRIATFIPKIQDTSDSTSQNQIKQLERFLGDEHFRGLEVKTTLEEVLARLERFFAHTWFRRVWVLQEICHAKKVSVCCGRLADNTANSDGFLQADWAHVLQANKYLITAGIRFGMDNIGMPNLWLYLTDNEARVAVTNHTAIVRLLHKASKNFGASDPRDHLFALLGLGTETAKLTPLPLLISPNYTKSIPRVFADFTRWHIQYTNSLSVLGYAACSVRAAGVQNVSHSSPNWCMTPYHISDKPGLVYAEGLKHSAASDRALDKSLIQNYSDPLQLSLRGFRLDRIMRSMQITFVDDYSLNATGLSVLDPTGTSHKAGLQLIWHTFWVGKQEKPYGCEPLPDSEVCNCQQTLDNVIDLMTLGGTSVSHHADQGLERFSSSEMSKEILYRRFLANWIHENREAEHANLDLFCPHVQQLQSLAEGYPESNNEVFNTHMQMFVPACSKKLLQTQLDFTGLCSPAARSGDFIVTLFGGSVPFILRPEDGLQPQEEDKAGAKGRTWSFVGECYIKEYMDGRVTENLSKSGQESEVFDLR